MADAESVGVPDEHGRLTEPVPRPGSDGEHALQQWLGTTERADRFYDEQVLDHLNPRMWEFVECQEMFFLATADRHGECDSSFRAGPQGFLRVLDERTLLYPEYRGNGVHASLGNLEENPHVGLLLMDFQRARIGLHINGRAEICEDAAIRAEHPDLPYDAVPGRRAQLWVRVEVEEAYIHCAKHIPHLQKAPKGAAREWGTDDYKRKGGDFFGSARDARERGSVERPPREHVASEAPAAPASPASPVAPPPPPPTALPAAYPAPPVVAPSTAVPAAAIPAPPTMPPPETPSPHTWNGLPPNGTPANGTPTNGTPTNGFPPDGTDALDGSSAINALPPVPPQPPQPMLPPQSPEPPGPLGTPLPQQREAPERASDEETEALQVPEPLEQQEPREATVMPDVTEAAEIPSPRSWLEEAERALAEARNRAVHGGQSSSFHGWFS